MITDQFRENEIQVLIALVELANPIDSPNNNSYKPFPGSMDEARRYFRKFAVDLADAFGSLQAKGYARQEGDKWVLTTSGKKVAEEVRRRRPPIYYWYRDFYTAIENSAAFDEYSKRVFGENLGQHGFSDVKQLQKMLDLLKLDEFTRVLDIGCGNGKIAEYISDRTKASVTGIDYIPEAIAQASQRTKGKTERLHFQAGNMESIEIGEESYDVILSIDSIYFNDVITILARWKRWLKPAGRMAVFYLSMNGEDLSVPLKDNGLPYTTHDLSGDNWQHMQLKHQVAAEMKEAFTAEGNDFIWQNMREESVSKSEAYNPLIHKMRRYLYIVKK
jgi:ubiquinone/menaquinone biosynthesis C-methylase UbiE